MSSARVAFTIALLGVACLGLQLWRVNRSWVALYEECLASRPTLVPQEASVDTEQSLALLRALERSLVAKQEFLSAQQASVEKARYELAKEREHSDVTTRPR